MSYSVKEIFLTLQGEGRHAGRPAVFCRFAGCNLWSGRPADRDTAACAFCDTDFVGTDGTNGGKYGSATLLAAAIEAEWGGSPDRRFVVLTGGEPLLQVDEHLVAALHVLGFAIAVETNGTVAPPAGIDWLCVSPKGASKLAILRADELKLAFPQQDAPPERFEAMDVGEFRLQPIDGPDLAGNTKAAIAYCLAHRQWHLSTQTHKFVGLR